MSKNIEIKARIESVAKLLPVALALAEGEPSTIHQDDTFFPCPQGRLKLRTLSDTNGELIFYQRPDQLGPKECFYSLSHTNEPNKLRAVLILSYGELGSVRKRRTLLQIGQTRLHLDEVDGLGDFMELEVVLSNEETSEQGIAIAEVLLGQLGITKDQLIEGAYMDLILKKS